MLSPVSGGRDILGKTRENLTRGGLDQDQNCLLGTELLWLNSRARALANIGDHRDIHTNTQSGDHKIVSDRDSGREWQDHKLEIYLSLTEYF